MSTPDLTAVWKEIMADPSIRIPDDLVRAHIQKLEKLTANGRFDAAYPLVCTDVIGTLLSIGGGNFHYNETLVQILDKLQKAGRHINVMSSNALQADREIEKLGRHKDFLTRSFTNDKPKYKEMEAIRACKKPFAELYIDDHEGTRKDWKKGAVSVWDPAVLKP